eukprot:GHVN01050195.1.p1 GENE.GHVN01050195.1~~GHVN01050195.1.p1  ORF type:complete len:130 (-),score=16.89 GHVN01050195.1:105-494(-)
MLCEGVCKPVYKATEYVFYPPRMKPSDSVEVQVAVGVLGLFCGVIPFLALYPFRGGEYIKYVYIACIQIVGWVFIGIGADNPGKPLAWIGATIALITMLVLMINAVFMLEQVCRRCKENLQEKTPLMPA